MRTELPDSDRYERLFNVVIAPSVAFITAFTRRNTVCHPRRKPHLFRIDYYILLLKREGVSHMGQTKHLLYTHKSVKLFTVYSVLVLRVGFYLWSVAWPPSGVVLAQNHRCMVISIAAPSLRITASTVCMISFRISPVGQQFIVAEGRVTLQLRIFPFPFK